MAWPTSRAQTVDGLAKAHEHFEALVGVIEGVVGESSTGKAELRECLTQIDRLLGLFEGHSQVECELVKAMDGRVSVLSRVLIGERSLAEDA